MSDVTASTTPTIPPPPTISATAADTTPPVLTTPPRSTESAPVPLVPVERSEPSSEPPPGHEHPAGAARIDAIAEQQPSTPKRQAGILRVLVMRMRTRSSRLLPRVGALLRRDEGMSTAEYAVGTVAAVAFSAALYKVVTSDVVTDGLSAVIGKALNATF